MLTFLDAKLFARQKGGSWWCSCSGPLLAQRRVYSNKWLAYPSSQANMWVEEWKELGQMYLVWCKIPIFNLDIIYRSFICIHDLCILLFCFSWILILETLSNSRTNLRELEASQKSIFDLSKLGKLNQIVFQNSFPNYFKIKREDKMTSSKTAKKYWNLNFEFWNILFDFICKFIYFYWGAY